MKPVVIITAVRQEIALLETRLRRPRTVTIGPLDCRRGFIGTTPVVLCVGGVGKVNAALATAIIIERQKPALVINTGCGGAYPGSGLTVGDLAVADEEIHGDEGVLTTEGWLDFRQMGFPLAKCGDTRYYNRLPLTGSRVERTNETAGRSGDRLHRGAFVTVSTCSGTRRRGEELEERYGAIVENMEGAAVAQVCLLYGVECLEIRGISNMVDERDMSTWDIPRAVEAAQRFVLKCLEDMACLQLQHPV